MENKKWLPHLTNEMMIGARGNNLCSYLIALEGWRRGLELKFYSKPVKRTRIHAPGRLFSLSSPNKKHFFYKARGSDVSQASVNISRNKDEAKQLLGKKGIPVPKGKRFLNENTDDEVIRYANQLGYPLVLKPTKGDQGVGVIANIQSKEHFKDALTTVRKDFTDVIVENYIKGEEYRVFVLEDEVLAVLKRIPAHVIGDGIHSIKELIDLKNKKRRKNPRLYSCLIKVDEELKRYINLIGLSLESIPGKKERVFLRENSNVSTGGDSVDITDEFPIEIKETAIQALKAMPGLAHAGIDIIVNPDLPLDQAGFVIEINAVPQIGSLVFPMIGKARDIPSALIDYYFPETKDKKEYNSKVYFDFKAIIQPLLDKSAKEITVTPAPSIPFIKRKYSIRGSVQNPRYIRWVRRKAIENNLSGYIRTDKKDSLNIIVGGTPSAVEHFKEILKEGPHSSVLEILESEWKKPIKVTFEIKKGKKPKKVSKPPVQSKPKQSSVKLKRLIKRFMKK